MLAAEQSWQVEAALSANAPLKMFPQFSKAIRHTHRLFFLRVDEQSSRIEVWSSASAARTVRNRCRRVQEMINRGGTRVAML